MTTHQLTFDRALTEIAWIPAFVGMTSYHLSIDGVLFSIREENAKKCKIYLTKCKAYYTFANIEKPKSTRG